MAGRLIAPAGPLFARQGGWATCWSIAILDLDDTAARRTAAEIAGNRSAAALGIAADVSDEDSVDAAIAQVEAGLPPITGLADVRER